MCGECNAAAENVEPSEDLNTVNVHDGTWRRVERGDIIVEGDYWHDSIGRAYPSTCAGQILHLDTLWRRIPENERTPIQEEPIIVPPIVSDGEDNRPEEQRKLDNILSGIVSRVYDATNQKYDTAIEVLHRLHPHGYGIDDHGGLFTIGYTGKRKPLTIPQLRDQLNFTSNSDQFATILQRMGKAYLPKLKMAHGDDIHDVFGKYRPGSCMSGPACRDMREIYACNPEFIGIIYSVRSNDNPLIESSCSALFWIGNKRVYLDRMYSAGSYSHSVQYDWLCDHLETIYGKPCVPIHHHSAKRPLWHKTITFKLKDSGNPLPYIDTIYTVKQYDDKHVWLTSDEGASTIHCRDTSGTYPDGKDRCQCCECGCRMDEDDTRSDNDGNVYCDDCYSDNFAHCEWTEENYPADEVQSVECWCYGSRYRERNASRNNSYQLGWHTLAISNDALDSYFTELHDGRYASIGNTVEDNRGNVYASDCDSWDNVTLTEDGDLYHVDDVVQLSDGRTYPTDEGVEVDGEWYLSGEEPEQDGDSTKDSENENNLVKSEVTE